MAIITQDPVDELPAEVQHCRVGVYVCNGQAIKLNEGICVEANSVKDSLTATLELCF